MQNYQRIISQSGDLPRASSTNYNLELLTTSSSDPPIRAHPPSRATNQGVPRPHPPGRWLLTQPPEDLLGIGLLAERLEFFGKLLVAAGFGNHGPTTLTTVPNAGLLELPKVFELLH